MIAQVEIVSPAETLDRWTGDMERQGYEPFPVAAVGIRYLADGRQHVSVLVALEGHGPARFCSSLDPGVPEADMIPDGVCPDCDREAILMEPLNFAPDWVQEMVHANQPEWWRADYWAAA